MSSLVPTTKPGIYVAIFLCMAGVLIGDYMTPLGIAIWILYLIPIVLTLFTWRPSVPILVATIVTVLIIVTYFTDTPGVSQDVVRINRCLGLFTVWTMAYSCYQAIRNKVSVRRHEWLQIGQTTLNDRMAGNQRLDELGQNILRFLSEYLDAHAGAFFVEDEGRFRRFATYAVPDETAVPDEIRPGQGLLGQAVVDRRTFMIPELPEGYLKLGSALGQAQPRTLLVAPVAEDDQVTGVIELGFAHPLLSHGTELLERVSESIAVAVRTAKFRTRLQELNEETQRQNEELQAQGEELRVSNEELEEQSRALKESQAMLQQQQAELEQTNVQLEEQSNRLEQQRDELARVKVSLEQQAEDLEQASQYKSDFLANMSHELRTPLNSSLILAKLLADNREGNLTEEQMKYARTIHSAGNDLLTLINDILDLSKIEAGHMEVQSARVRVADLLERMTRTFQPIAGQRGLAFRTEVVPGSPADLETDSQRLEQILKNLLSNAFKFTEKGEVTLTVSPGDDGQILFRVSDTGIGIPEHQHGTVFEAFRQADGTTSRKYGGTGLGLSITRQLAALLGGSISLSSEVGKGSSFALTLPRVYVPAPGRPTPTPAPIQVPKIEIAKKADDSEPRFEKGQFADDRGRVRPGGRAILAIEDDEHFARILYDLADEFGFKCVIATSAEEGLELAERMLPQAVVLDIGLPDHSGLAVLDRLKQSARTRHIPVHVVSASDYTQAALQLGAVGYMLKPVKREELVRAFQNFEERLTQKVRRILIVEDDAVQLDSLRLLLGTPDVETVGASTAAECLDLLKSATFDCMVLDLSLPDASGFTLLETLSHEDRYSFPPVIVYTGRDLSPDEEQQLRRYSQSIIVKGAKSPERLLDEVTLFLHQVVSELPPEQQKMLERVRSWDSTLENRCILIAEDDVRNVFALTSILEPRGAKVVIARNGREAIAVLDQAQEKGEPPIDLVLMDVMMPEMDGLTAMREIRNRPDWRKLPIIALTAKAMKNDQEECIAAGANDYMAKPLDVEKLLSLIRVWLPR